MAFNPKEQEVDEFNFGGAGTRRWVNKPINTTFDDDYMPPSNGNKKQVGGSHYNSHTIQPWDIIDEYSLDYYEGNVLKYLLRLKNDRKEDLEKALHYLEKALEGYE